MKHFQFSAHSIEQIKARQLDKEIIEDVLINPEKTIQQDNHSAFFQKVVHEDNKQYLYRVLVNIKKDPQLVITAYKTSKIEKYENQV